MFLRCVGLCAILLVSVNCRSQNSYMWSGFYGGEDLDWVTDSDVDSLGNIYIVGGTYSETGVSVSGFQPDFAGGQSDGFLMKLSPGGTLLWSTYYGTPQDERLTGVIVDSDNNVIVVGDAYGSGGMNIASPGAYQSSPNGYTDAIIAKFSPDGTRLWGTYFGGEDYDRAYDVKVDGNDHIYVAGWTQSDNGISIDGYQNNFGGNYDMFLAKFSTDGVPIWSTYYGGPASDHGNALAIDSEQNIYVGGSTSDQSIAYSAFDSTFEGMRDAFVAKFGQDGALIWCNYFGGEDVESVEAMTIDPFDNLGILGMSKSTEGIFHNGFQSELFGEWDCFLVKMSSDGQLIWSTYYGGTTGEEAFSIDTDIYGNFYVAGDTYSSDMIVGEGLRENLVGTENIFVAKFDPDGVMECATYYGTMHDEDGHVCVASSATLYLIGSLEDQSGIPTGGLGDYAGGEFDICATRLHTCHPDFAVDVSVTNNSCYSECNGSATATANYGTAPYTFEWNTDPVQDSSTAIGLCAGTYRVKVTDADNSVVFDIATISQPDELLAEAEHVSACEGNNGLALVSPIGGVEPYSVLWIPTNETTDTIYGLSPGEYSVIVQDAFDCVFYDTVLIQSGPPIQSSVVSVNDVGCFGGSDGSATILATGGTSPFSFTWEPSGETTSTATGLSAGDHTVHVSDSVGCGGYVSVHINEPGLLDTVVTLTVCDAFQSATGSTVWTESGVYTETLASSSGCDSLVTYDLTFYYTTITSITESTCDSLKSPDGLESWTESGVYYDTLYSVWGCDSVIRVHLTVEEVSENLSRIGSLFHSYENNADFYQWINCITGEPIEGATEQDYLATAPGTYACVVTNNGCSDTTNCLTLAGTGVNELGTNPLQLFPNPADGCLNLKFAVGMLKPTDLSVVDMMGREVLLVKYASGASGYVVDVSGLSAGNYVVVVSSEKGVFREKVVIAK